MTDRSRKARPRNDLPSQPPNGFEPLTCGLQNRCGDSLTHDDTDTYESDGKNLASCLALLRQESPELASIVNAWPTLSGPIRAAILAMIRSATESTKE